MLEENNEKLNQKYKYLYKGREEDRIEFEKYRNK